MDEDLVVSKYPHLRFAEKITVELDFNGVAFVLRDQTKVLYYSARMICEEVVNDIILSS